MVCLFVFVHLVPFNFCQMALHLDFKCNGIVFSRGVSMAKVLFRERMIFVFLILYFDVEFALRLIAKV